MKTDIPLSPGGCVLTQPLLIWSTLDRYDSIKISKSEGRAAVPFKIVRNDITNMQVNAIVNAASRLHRVNAVADSAIHNSGKKNSTALKKASC